jgi:hypothetical protein
VIHTQNNPVCIVLDNSTYVGSNSGDVTTVTLSTTNSMSNPSVDSLWNLYSKLTLVSFDRLNASDATRAVLNPFSGNLTNITTLDTTTYTFPTALLTQTGKPQSITNVTISRTRVLPLLPFMNAPASAASTTTLLLILTGRKVAEGVDGLSEVLQTEMEDGKLWAYEDAPVSRDDAGSGAQKASVNGTNEWVEFGTSTVFNKWRTNDTTAFPVQDVGDWCDV